MINTKFKGLRCVHRHTWPDHKSCFLHGRIHPKDIKKLEKRNKLWYKEPEIKICYVDIETTGIDGADVELMLSWAIKERGNKVYCDCITKSELFDGSFDRRIVKSCIEKLREFDIIIGYYSKRFDIPFLRTKAVKYDLDFPTYEEAYHWDLYDTIKRKFNLSRRSLDAATKYFGIAGKTHLDREIWLKARYGDKESLKYVLEHNINDTIITEALHDKLEFSGKWIKSVL